MTASIVITAYNVASYIEQSIKSALAQNINEVIVVEDCPTDGTGDIISRLEKENPDILKVIHNTENVGAGMSRRIGIEAATSDYVLLLDGDDWLNDGYVQTLLDNAGESDIVCGGVSKIWDDGMVERSSFANKVETGIEKFYAHLKEKVKFLNNKLVRRSLYEQVPYCSRRFIEDTPTLFPLLYNANELRYVDVDGYNYRMRDDSLINGSSKAKYLMFCALAVKDLVNWFRDKPLEYRVNFKRGRFIMLSDRFNQCPKEDIEEVKRNYPKDYAEFMVNVKVYKAQHLTFRSI